MEQQKSTPAPGRDIAPEGGVSLRGISPLKGTLQAPRRLGKSRPRHFHLSQGGSFV